MLHQKKFFDSLKEKMNNFGDLSDTGHEELEGLIRAGFDMAPTVDHIYDHRCRCFACQSKEISLQKKISKEKKK